MLASAKTHVSVAIGAILFSSAGCRGIIGITLGFLLCREALSASCASCAIVYGKASDLRKVLVESDLAETRLDALHTLFAFSRPKASSTSRQFTHARLRLRKIQVQRYVCYR